MKGYLRDLYWWLLYGTTDPDRIACARGGHDWERQSDETIFHVPEGAPKERHSDLPDDRTLWGDAEVAGSVPGVGGAPPAEPGGAYTYTIRETQTYYCQRDHCTATKTRTVP